MPGDSYVARLSRHACPGDMPDRAPKRLVAGSFRNDRGKIETGYGDASNQTIGLHGGQRYAGRGPFRHETFERGTLQLLKNPGVQCDEPVVTQQQDRAG